MKIPWRHMTAGILLAFLASAAGAPGAYDSYRFHTRHELREEEAGQIRSTIKYFGATLAGFYALGGATPWGLNKFPSEKGIKRRIFQDIENWKKGGKVLVMDRDKSTVTDVRFLAPDRAVAVADENWYSEYQDRETRRQSSEKHANFITVRYFLKKQGGEWIVVEYAVYPQGEPLSWDPVERFSKW